MSTIREALHGFRQRALDRLRGEPSIERLVAQGLQLGEEPHISRPVYLDTGHPWLITIGDYVTLSPYVAVITHDPSLAHYTSKTRLGSVTIGNRVNVGVGSIILPGTNIGDDSVVGAGAVVQGEVPPGSLVMPEPAKVSPIKPIAAWHQASAARAPSWAGEGWSLVSGISEERKREQREALADGGSGYVPATAAPGSPHKRDTNGQ
jgi:maltose O-acetyltransferase